MGGLSSKINALERAIGNLKSSYDAASSQKRLEDLWPAVTAGDISVLKEYGKLENRLGEYNELKGDAEFLIDYAKDVEATANQTDAAVTSKEMTNCLLRMRDFILEQKFTEKDDDRNAIISFQIHQGWDQMTQYMEDLRTAYRKFAEKKGFQIEYVDVGDSRECTIRVSGEYSYAFFRGENGLHKFYYISDNTTGHSSAKKTHTGSLTVRVRPEVEMPSVELKKEDLEISHLAASTPGGSNANTSNTGVRITHKPTGITVTSRMRSQHRNLELAREILIYRVAERLENTVKKDVRSLWGHFVRTYKLATERIISDNQTGMKTYDIESFFNGEIEDYILAYHGISFEIPKNGNGK